jgi:hypothetical protein
VQDLGEDAFPEPKRSATPDDASSRTIAPESTASASEAIESSQESTSTHLQKLGVLPELDSLRVLGVRIANLGQITLDALVDAIPEQMLAISLTTVISDQPLVCPLLFLHRFYYSY